MTKERAINWIFYTKDWKTPPTTGISQAMWDAMVKHLKRENYMDFL